MFYSLRASHWGQIQYGATAARPAHRPAACLRARYCNNELLFVGRIARDWSEEQILKVKAEVRQRRDGNHLHLIDAAVGLERKGHEGVRVQTPVAPPRDEGVVLPVFEVAHQTRRVAEAEDEFARFERNRYFSVPGVPIAPGVFRQWRRRLRLGVSRGALILLHLFCLGQLLFGEGAKG